MTKELQQNSILRRNQVIQRTGISTSSMYNYIADGLFPKPIQLGTRSVGWLEQEVDEWLQLRIDKRDQVQEVANG